MKIIVGLGNPGEQYKANRHNVGFMLVDRLAEKGWESKFDAEVSRLGETLIVKPQTFMNKSGEVVAKIANFYKIDLSGLFVVHDDLDIRLGDYKIQFGVGPKVHYGVNSIEGSLGSMEFWRVRVGVDNRQRVSGSAGQRVSGEEYVLSDFTVNEKKIIDGVIEKAVNELILLL